jgi:CrcB protein
MLQRLLLIAVAGALGTLARYGLGGMFQKITLSGLPVGTLIVNIVGCFLFGLIWTLAEERMVIDPEARVIMLGGFMGAFTTFSTFIFETGGFVRESEWLLATGNVAVQTVIGLAFFFVGILVARAF